MVGRLIRWAVAGLVLGILVAPTADAGVVWMEDPSAPAVFLGGAGPQAVGPGVDTIRGTISGGDEGDLFKLYFPAAGTLDIRTQTLLSPLIPTLFLFDADGRGLLADISNAGTQGEARIGLSVTPGIYYIGIGDAPLQAVDTDGDVWDSLTASNSPPPPSFGVLERIRNTGPVVQPGNYRIFLSMETGEIPSTPPDVPEPSLLSLVGCGLLAALRRR